MVFSLLVSSLLLQFESLMQKRWSSDLTLIDTKNTEGPRSPHSVCLLPHYFASSLSNPSPTKTSHRPTTRTWTHNFHPSPTNVVSLLLPPHATKNTSLCGSVSPCASPRRPWNAATATDNMATFGSFTANFTAPDRSPQKGELPLSEDRDFAANGKVMMLVLVLLVASLFILPVVLSCMKHRHVHSHARGLHGHNEPAGHSGLHTPIQFPMANQVKGHSAGSGENFLYANAHQTV